MKLIITEKPSVAFDVAKGIGGKIEKKDGYLKVGDYCITWCFGHLLEIDDSAAPKKWDLESLPILPQKFNYRVIKGKGKQFKVIKELLKKADEVVISTDAGREGEAIARLVLQQAGLSDWSKVKRLWTSLSLTPEVVKKELRNLKPSKDFDSLYFSALARQHSDWVVGINLTRLLTLKADDGTVWSAGRVQTPVLKLIVDREREIKEFRPEDYYIISALLEKGKEKFRTVIDYEKLVKDGVLKEGELLKKEKAEKILSDLSKEKEAVVVSVKKQKKREKPLRLHSLTSLQKEANKLHGYTLERVLYIAQKLYQDYKVISYPRTDAEYMGEKNKNLVISILKKLIREPDKAKKLGRIGRKIADSLSQSLISGVQKVGKRVFDDSKLTDHHAIIPLAPLPETAKEEEKRIYSLILRRFVGAFMEDFEYEAVTVRFRIGNYEFVSQGKRVLSLGWKALYEGENEFLLSELMEGEKLSVLKLSSDKKLTQPPPRWSEGSLVEFMKKINLGTPATRASMIETLKSRSYVVSLKKSLVPTEKAFKLLEALEDSKVSSPELTGEWERKLDEIYTKRLGKEGYRNFYSAICQFVSEEVEKLKEKKIESKRQATRKMLEFAKKLSKQTGKRFSGTDYETVKNFIDSALKELKEKQENGITTCSARKQGMEVRILRKSCLEEVSKQVSDRKASC